MQMGVSVTIYKGPTGSSNPMLVIMESLLRVQGIQHQTVVDTGSVMKLSGGTQNPLTGVCAQATDGTIIKDVFDLCDWIRNTGLKRL